MKRILVALVMMLLAGAMPLGTLGAHVSAAPSYFGVDVTTPVCDNPHLAQATGGSNPGPSICDQHTQNTSTNTLFGPSGIATIVVRVLSIVVGVAAVLVIMVAGFRFIFANGDASTLSQARNALIYALVGVVVAVMAQALVTFVLDKVQ